MTGALLAAALVQSAPPEAAPGNSRKAAVLNRIADEIEHNLAPFLGGGHVAAGEARLAEATQSGRTAEIYEARFLLGDARLTAGQIEAAIADFEACLETAQRSRDERAWANSARRLALAWLRAGERANCCVRHNADSCILPLRDGAIHVDRTGSERAMAVLQQVLSRDGSDLGSIWLLNIAAMTLGSWPDGVPKHWRIPADAFDSEYDLPRMTDLAPKLGLASPDLSGGSIFDDFDGDGRLELVTSSIHPREPLKYWKLQPDGTFKDRAKELGLSGQLGGLQIAHFDANNDGRLDLIVQRGAWLREFGRIPNSLLIQQEDGTFADRTLEAGIEIAAPSQVAVTADVDLDGDLDLFLGYENHDAESIQELPSRLFLNHGDGTFKDATQRAGVQNRRYCKGAAFGDYDGDGWPDLYVSNLGAPNRLYHNNRDGTFTDVAMELGVSNPIESFSCWFFDYDNDGWLDLYVTDYNRAQRNPQMTEHYRKGRVTGPDSQRLYRNDGRGGFRDVSKECAMDRVVFPMGSNFGDVDNDGWPDLYLATGDPEFSSLWPNIMLRNGAGPEGGRRFQDVTTATGTGHLQKGHGVSFGDWDEDGDQDLFVQMGGAQLDDGFQDALFENPGHGNHWITVRLVGRDSNRFGVGSRIKVSIEEPAAAAGQDAGGVSRRDVFHFVGTNSSFGGNSLQAELGLGKATRIEALEVFWPRTRKTQRFAPPDRAVPLDRIVVVDEGSDALVVLPPAAR